MKTLLRILGPPPTPHPMSRLLPVTPSWGQAPQQIFNGKRIMINIRYHSCPAMSMHIVGESGPDELLHESTMSEWFSGPM